MSEACSKFENDENTTNDSVKSEIPFVEVKQENTFVDLYEENEEFHLEGEEPENKKFDIEEGEIEKGEVEKKEQIFVEPDLLKSEVKDEQLEEKEMHFDGEKYSCQVCNINFDELYQLQLHVFEQHRDSRYDKN